MKRHFLLFFTCFILIAGAYFTADCHSLAAEYDPILKAKPMKGIVHFKQTIKRG